MREPVRIKSEPTLGQALLPVAVLIVLLASSVYLFGDSSSSGPNQIALILSGGLAVLLGLRNGYAWKEMERGMVNGISLAMGALLILLAVGSLIGTWILAGTVPTMIYYGLQILSPAIFFAAATVICAFVALATGSSWTTASTIGIALIGIAAAQNLNLGLAAGAIISGAYFGDKMSPLSDTTNLAPAMAGSELFEHIRHMVWTTTPSLLIALVLFTLIGFMGTPPQQTGELEEVLQVLNAEFVIGPHLLLPAALVLILVVRRMPAFPAILLGALTGGVFAALFQQRAVLAYVGDTDLSHGVAVLKGVWIALFDGFRAEFRKCDARRVAESRRHVQHAHDGLAHHVRNDVRRRDGDDQDVAEDRDRHPEFRARHRESHHRHHRHRHRHEHRRVGPVHLDRAAGPDVPR